MTEKTKTKTNTSTKNQNQQTKNQNQTKNQPTNEPTTKNNEVLFEVLTVLKDIRDLLETRLKKPIDTSIFHNK